MYPTVPGHPDYTVTGSKFIPEIWSGKILKKYYDYTVLASITNTNYEGEIKNQGDTVFIRTVPTITIRDHAIGQKVTYERPESPPLTLLIDKGKSWGVEIDDIIKVQSDLDLLSQWTDDAAMQLKISVERSFFSAVYADPHASNRGTTAGVISAGYNMGVAGSPLAVTKVNVLDYIVDMGSVLDEQNVPETGRWIVIPTWMAGLIKKSDLKDASLTGDGTSVLRNGRLGMIDRFTLYSSNLLYSVVDGAVTAYYSMFGHNDGMTFASQLTKTETLRSQDAFADLLRGLKVYGHKTIKPEAIGVFYCYKG